MTNHDFITLSISDGTEMDAYVAIPDVAGKQPAIILLQEAFGVNGHIRDVAERLCKHGYAVIAPELFHRSGERIEIPYTDFDRVIPIMKAMTNDGAIADLKACYEWTQEQSFIHTDKIGAIGFCMGGRMAFLANIHLPLTAAVSYYGGGTDKLLDAVDQLHCTQLFYWGGLDHHIPQESIDKTMAALKAAGKDYTNVVISYADHGFNCDVRESYNPQAAKEAWGHTLAFFEGRLK